jgi:hypothetical protein
MKFEWYIVSFGAAPDDRPPPPVALNCDPIGFDEDDVDVEVGDNVEPNFALWFTSSCDNFFHNSSRSFSFLFSLFYLNQNLVNFNIKCCFSSIFALHQSPHKTQPQESENYFDIIVRLV